MLANRNMVQSELHESSIVWRDVLFDIIPMHRLKPVMMRAIKNHTSSFPVNAFDLLNAFREIEQEEQAEKSRIFDEEKAKKPVLFCENQKQHKNADGEVEILDWLNFSKTVVVPCQFCRPVAYEASRSRHIAKNKVQDISPLEIAQTFAEKSGLIPNEVDPVKIITDALRLVGRERLSCGGTSYAGELHDVWEKLLRIKEYLRNNGETYIL